MFNIFHHIKQSIKIIAVIICVMIIVSCNNSPQPPQDKGILPEQNYLQPQSVKEVTGIIINYKANRDGDIDKLILQTANDTLLIHFPPHTARQLMNTAAKNTKVHVWLGNDKKPPKHNDDMNNKKHYELISLHAQANGITINVHDIPPPKPVPGNEVVVTGNKLQWQSDDDGQAGDFILSGKLIALPPHVKESLLPLLKNAHSIIIKGYERNAADGFVNISGLILIKPFAITIDSVNYIVP